MMSKTAGILTLGVHCLLAVLATQARSQETLPAAGHIAEVNGMQMYYETYGEGEPLVLLHGFTGHGGHWKDKGEEFSKKFQVIIPDLRGHGRSTNPVEEFTHRQSAKDVYALLDQLGIEKFKACGMSSGGMTLLHMATSQPDRVEAMVLIEATHYFPEQARKIMRESHRDHVSETEMEKNERFISTATSRF